MKSKYHKLKERFEGSLAKPLDITHEDANMFGCFPCPVCGSRFRWPTQHGTVVCDECTLTQHIPKNLVP